MIHLQQYGQYFCMVIFLCFFYTQPLQAAEQAEHVYQISMNLAAQGKLSQSITALHAAAAVLPEADIWRERMLAAASLLAMQKIQGLQQTTTEENNYSRLAEAYIKAHAKPKYRSVWPAALLATIMPGSGHAWLGRWGDALTAALFVWPLLILTLWAAWRKMGPVTVFFALLTLWFWSGSVFSAISLAERGSFAAYMQWWQALWQASALPGQPW